MNDLVKRVDHNRAQELKEVIERPVHQGCVGLITTFHGFTRYALLDELLDPDRDEEVRFVATVFAVQQIVMADYPDMNPVENAAHHDREFLPTLAAAYRDLFAALARVYADVLSDIPEIKWMGDRVRRQVEETP